ncbi:hypothetical protein BJ138DRAFT_1163415 [Hygrophoropsis aurantiaca]|uniref:Uncharacterized protein n=1 Tax=Hygrophoropsis aurantiaca TaxID=72124 RepID=A0ACB7ZYI7_9AGAM|nr:hypothetical protein BJ138DRAFT_1163415 [Hygrophoropsis aurantiaca]
MNILSSLLFAIKFTLRICASHSPPTTQCPPIALSSGLNLYTLFSIHRTIAHQPNSDHHCHHLSPSSEDGTNRFH